MHVACWCTQCPNCSTMHLDILMYVYKIVCNKLYHFMCAFSICMFECAIDSANGCCSSYDMIAGTSI